MQNFNTKAGFLQGKITISHICKIIIGHTCTAAEVFLPGF